jgi:predicted TIM-barrel fold metal-dependent hydrolase
MHRRDFVKHSGACALALLGRSVVGAERQEKATLLDGLPVIDTHQHLWDLNQFELPRPGGPPAERRHPSDEYREAIEGLNVVKAVYMEVAVADEQLVAEADSVVALCRRGGTPTVAGVIGGRPADPGFRSYMARYKEGPYIKGVRQILRLPQADPAMALDAGFQAGIRLLGELGMCFDLCTPPERLPDAIKLVDACPQTRFVLDHCGNADPQSFEVARCGGRVSHPPTHDPEQWRRDMAAIARRDRVVCKISGIVSQADKERWRAEDLAPIVNHCLEVFGPDRVMFASDWPICTRVATLRQWAEALWTIVQNRSATERRKLFHDNAARFYGIA